MGKVYNIMDRLTNDKPQIQIDNDHIYTVNNSKNQAIFIKQLSEDKSVDEFKRMDNIIEAALGKEALDFINTLNLSVTSTSVVINAIMAAIGEVELEEVEKEVKKQSKGFRK
jgi:thermostable 8-oxoguanine DNA glycosylase